MSGKSLLPDKVVMKALPSAVRIPVPRVPQPTASPAIQKKPNSGPPPVYRPAPANVAVGRTVNSTLGKFPPLAQPAKAPAAFVQSKHQCLPATKNSGLVAQPKAAVAAALETRPAPPVYRPQAVAGLQSKLSASSPWVSARPGNPARPILPARQGLQPLGIRTAPAPGVHVTKQAGIQRNVNSVNRAQVSSAASVASNRNLRSPSPLSGSRRASVNGSAIQRQLQWVEGGRAKNKNLANSFLRYIDFGITPILLNDLEFPGRDAPTLHAPAFLIEHKDGHVELSVVAEVVNRVGYRMELPSAGPWVAQETIGRVSAGLTNAEHSAISDEFLGDGSTMVTVEARGLPNNAEFATRVERHENFHVNDIKEKVNAILVPWDEAIFQFMRQRKKIIAETEQKAIEEFYEQVGGTPQKIASKFISTLRASGNAFHTTAKGKSPWVDSYMAAADEVTVYWDMPSVT